MEPEPTFAEAARVLRPGGVFAAYDYDVVPAVDPELDNAFRAYQHRRTEARERRGIRQGADRWPKTGHLGRMRASRRFRVCREVVLHSVEDGDAGRIGGLAPRPGLPRAGKSDRELMRGARPGGLDSAAPRVLVNRT